MPASARRRRIDGSPCWEGRDSQVRYVTGKPEQVPRFRSLPALAGAMRCCTRCELAEGRTRVVRGVGNRSAKVLLIGEAPGASEDKAGEPFVGAAGRLLDKLLATAGLGRDDVYITNIVACRPPSNRTPRVREVKAHAPWIEEQLRLIRPALIVTLGRVALTYFIPKARVTQLRGKPQVVQHNGRELTILPMLHPAAALRDPALRPRLQTDFRKLRRLARQMLES